MYRLRWYCWAILNGGRFDDLRTIYQGCRALPFALAGLSCLLSYDVDLVVANWPLDFARQPRWCKRDIRLISEVSAGVSWENRGSLLNGQLIRPVLCGCAAGRCIAAAAYCLVRRLDCHLVSLADTLRRCRPKAMAIVRRCWRRTSLRPKTVAVF